VTVVVGEEAHSQGGKVQRPGKQNDRAKMPRSECEVAAQDHPPIRFGGVSGVKRWRPFCGPDRGSPIAYLPNARPEKTKKFNKG